METRPPISAQKRKNMRYANTDMLFFEGMWDDGSQMPKPWVFASVFALHALAVWGLINSKTMNFERQKPIPIEIIYEEPKPEIKEPEPIKEEPPEPILYQKPVEKPIEKLETTPKPFKLEEAVLKPQVQKIENDPNIDRLKPPPVPKTEEPPKPTTEPEAKPKLIDIEKMMRELKPKVKGPDIKTDELGNSVDKSLFSNKNPNSVLLKEPKSAPDANLETKALNPNSKIIDDPKITDLMKLEQPKDYSKPSPIENQNKIDFKKPVISDNSQNLDNKQKAALEKFNKEELARLKQLEALEKQKQSSIPANNTPIAPNGELPKPSGVTAVNPGELNQSGGGPPPPSISPPASSGQSGGALPKKPASYGKGSKNLFETGEDNSAIGKVGRAIDCAKLGQKERSEKCPNWQPLEQGPKKDIAPKPPKGFDPSKTKNKEPMVACPKDHPNGNLGLPCIPQNKDSKIKF